MHSKATLRILWKEISIYSAGEITTIPAKDFFITSRSAYLYPNSQEDHLSFLLVNGKNEILNILIKGISPLDFPFVDFILLPLALIL